VDRVRDVCSSHAGEAASVVLMGDKLSQVVDSLELGRSALNKIKQNLAWALAYNLVGIPLAAGGWCAHVTSDDVEHAPQKVDTCVPYHDVLLLFYTAGALLPAYGICLYPSVAAGMMAFSSVAVVSNSLLLRATFSTQPQAKMEAQKA
jgi:Cu2+-exporting ATPase